VRTNCNRADFFISKPHNYLEARPISCPVVIVEGPKSQAIESVICDSLQQLCMLEQW